MWNIVRRVLEFSPNYAEACFLQKQVSETKNQTHVHCRCQQRKTKPLNRVFDKTEIKIEKKDRKCESERRVRTDNVILQVVGVAVLRTIVADFKQKVLPAAHFLISCSVREAEAEEEEEPAV